jgi:hypothetical protein
MRLLVALALVVASSCGGKVAGNVAEAGSDEGVDTTRGGCGEGACDVGETCRLGCYSCVCEAKLGWRCSTGDCADADSPCPVELPKDRTLPCAGTAVCEYSAPCRAIAVCGGGTWHTKGCGAFADAGSTG